MPFDAKYLQSVLDGLVAAGGAGALMHYNHSSVEWRGSSGIAELGTSHSVHPTGWFRVGSVTKTFTAAAVLSLVAEGKLSLDDACVQWLPELVPATVTVRHLLGHTSGLRDYTDHAEALLQVARGERASWSLEKAVREASAQHPLFSPGRSWSYSNTNYILLGLLIEAVTGDTYASQVHKRIIEPLDLKQTEVPDGATTMPAPHAHGYVPLHGELVDMAEQNPSYAWSAGEIVSTAADLNHFYGALLTGQLLPPKELAAMLTVEDGSGGYGLGICRIQLADGTALWGHTGEIFGYLTISYHSTGAQRQLTISCTTTDAPAPDTETVLQALSAQQSPQSGTTAHWAPRDNA